MRRTDQTALRIGLVLTGGTIGSEYTGDRFARIRANDHDSLLDMQFVRSAWDESRPLDIVPRHLPARLSENLMPRDWVLIAEAIDSLRSEGLSGMLVLHGTDTASYTSAALSFLLADAGIPIVLTGSNYPPNQDNSDARTNVADALTALTYLGPGVYLSFSGTPGQPSWVHLGTKVRKVKASGQAFFSINRQPVARIEARHFIPERLNQAPVPVETPVLDIDDRVMAVRIFPGINLEAIGDLLLTSGARGLVVELYSSATGPTGEGEHSLPNLIRRCVEAGIVVVATVPTAPDGPVNFYESTIEIQDAGGQFIWDLLPETAIVKLMWALAQEQDPKSIRGLISRVIAGEFEADILGEGPQVTAGQLLGGP